jgi:MFS family permease
LKLKRLEFANSIRPFVCPIRRFGRKAVLLPSFLTLGLLYLLLTVAAPGIQLGLVITAIGFFFYTLLTVTNAAVLDIAGSSSHASSYGLTMLVTQFLVVPMPIVAGFVVGSYGIVAVFLLSAAFQFLAALVVMPLKMYQRVAIMPRNCICGEEPARPGPAGGRTLCTKGRAGASLGWQCPTTGLTPCTLRRALQVARRKTCVYNSYPLPSTHKAWSH